MSVTTSQHEAIARMESYKPVSRFLADPLEVGSALHLRPNSLCHFRFDLIVFTVNIVSSVEPTSKKCGDECHLYYFSHFHVKFMLFIAVFYYKEK